MKQNLYNDSFLKISEEKRNKILQVAISEFSEHGLESANINVIAKKSGISIGSMYSYFKSKEDLYSLTVCHAVETLKSVLDNIMKEDDDLLIIIEKIIRAIQHHSRTNISLTKLYNQMTVENRTELTFEIVSEVENISAALYTSIIEKVKKEKLIRSDADPKLFAFFLDNLFVSLQFSYSCSYYIERFKIYAGDDIFDKDEEVTTQLLKFIKGAFLI
jgi:AcrR family transcriptional regulator